MKKAVIIQARMGSSRLPGKVLKPIGGEAQLAQLLHRIGSAKVDLIAVATSDLPQDDAIEAFCQQAGIPCYRGSEWDVLARYTGAVAMLGLAPEDLVVRVTADCPLHHADVIDFATSHLVQHKLDYFSNSFAPHYEDGCDAEVMKVSALLQAAAEAKLLSQREHVTPYIKDSGLFLCGYKKFHPDYIFKLSVDTPEDHQMAEGIFQYFAPRRDFSIHEIVACLQEHPDMLEANRDSVINAGYAKSLREDRTV